MQLEFRQKGNEGGKEQEREGVRAGEPYGRGRKRRKGEEREGED